MTKATVPGGAPMPSGITVAVSVTDCPTADGFGVTVTRVIEGEAMKGPPNRVARWAVARHATPAQGAAAHRGPGDVHVRRSTPSRTRWKDARVTVPRRR